MICAGGDTGDDMIEDVEEFFIDSSNIGDVASAQAKAGDISGPLHETNSKALIAAVERDRALERQITGELNSSNRVNT